MSPTQRRRTRHARSLTRTQAQHTPPQAIYLDQSIDLLLCLVLVLYTRRVSWTDRGGGVEELETPTIDLEVDKKGASAVGIAWLYSTSARPSLIFVFQRLPLQQPRHFFFQYGNARLIGTRILPIREQNFFQVAVSESFDGRTCHDSR
jgi:hypothetical protein